MAEGPPQLLVVGEAIVAETLPEALWRRHGIRALGATSAELALSRVRIHPFRVAMVDLALADMDGLELSDKLRAARPGLKVALLVPRRDSPAKYPGVDAVIVKPYRLRQVYRVVRALLDDDSGPPRGPSRIA